MNSPKVLAWWYAVSLSGWGIACGGTPVGQGSEDGAVQEGTRPVDGSTSDAPVDEDSTWRGDSVRDSSESRDAARDASAFIDVSPSPDSSAVDSDAAAATQAIISSYCAALQACCQEAGIGDAGAIANCATELPRDVPELGMVSEGTLLIGAAGLEAWVKAYQQAAKDCLTPPFSTLDNLWIGTSGTGESCASSENCLTGSGPVVCLVGANESDGARAQGVCRSATRGTAGAACALSCAAGEDCSFTLYDSSPNPVTAVCFESDNLICSELTSTCVALTPIGGTCMASSECGGLAYCDMTSQTGKCQPLVGEGSPCANSDACSDQFECGTGGTCVAIPFASDPRCGGMLP